MNKLSILAHTRFLGIGFENMVSLAQLALFTGMRSISLLNLRWDDLDFERRFITLGGDVDKKKKTETVPRTPKPALFWKG
jgi:integrase